MKQFVRFFRDIHTARSAVSSKRFYGGVGFVCSVVFVAIWQHELVDELLYTSAGLIGFDTLRKIIRRAE